MRSQQTMRRWLRTDCFFANLNHSHGSLNSAVKLKSGPTRFRSEMSPEKLRRTAKLWNSLVVCRKFEFKQSSGRCQPAMLWPIDYGAPGEIRTPGLLVRSRNDD